MSQVDTLMTLLTAEQLNDDDDDDVASTQRV